MKSQVVLPSIQHLRIQPFGIQLHYPLGIGRTGCPEERLLVAAIDFFGHRKFRQISLKKCPAIWQTTGTTTKRPQDRNRSKSLAASTGGLRNGPTGILWPASANIRPSWSPVPVKSIHIIMLHRFWHCWPILTHILSMSHWLLLGQRWRPPICILTNGWAQVSEIHSMRLKNQWTVWLGDNNQAKEELLFSQILTHHRPPDRHCDKKQLSGLITHLLHFTSWSEIHIDTRHSNL